MNLENDQVNFSSPKKLITKSAVVGLTPMDTRIHINEFNNSIMLAVDNDVKGAISEYYTALVASITSATTVDDLSAADKALIDAILPCLAWFTYKRWLMNYGRGRPTGKGAKMRDSEFSADLDPEDYKSMIGSAEESGRSYYSDLVDYLKSIDTDNSMDDDEDVTTIYDTLSFVKNPYEHNRSTDIDLNV